MGSVIVIGAGAAGMAAAIAAAECGEHVTVLERMDRVGKKILATGNGRCNLMNTGDLRYPGGTSFAREVLSRCDVQAQTRFWHHLGLRLRQEEAGRVYPVSGMASSVLDTLRFALDALGVATVAPVHVTGIFRARHGWTVMAGEQKWKADRVIVACGGCAQPKLGSDGSGFRLLESLGHTIVLPRPALSQIITDTQPIKGLSGVRVRTSLRITRGSVEKYRESGELLFADYGVTGVCVMQCARYAEPGDELHIDLVKAMGFEAGEMLVSELYRRKNEWGRLRSLDGLLTGLCVPKLANAILDSAGITRGQRGTCADLTERAIDRIAEAAADFMLTVRGIKGFDSAQVTAGGADVKEFKADTLESRIAPGVHAAGEVLDVDGDCGGYNLMFAFASGILAGLNGKALPW